MQVYAHILTAAHLLAHGVWVDGVWFMEHRTVWRCTNRKRSAVEIKLRTCLTPFLSQRETQREESGETRDERKCRKEK